MTSDTPAPDLAQQLRDAQRALRLARAFGIHSRGFHAAQAAELAEWIDQGMRGAPPVYDSPFVNAWMAKHMPPAPPAPSGPPRIAAAALRFPDGRVVSLPPPARHNDLLAHCARRGEQIIQAEQGFVTTEDTWCDRRTALRIATEAGQLLRAPSAPYAGLFTEDVW